MTIPSLPDPHPADLDPTDAALRAAYAELVDDLRGRLDLAAGVEQATEPGPYRALTRDVARHLDLERGLAAITGAPTAPIGGQRRSEQGDSATPPDEHPRPVAGLSARERLELRVGLAFRHLRDLVALEEALARGYEDNVVVALVELHNDDLVRNLNLVRELGFARIHAVRLTRVLADDLAQRQARARARVGVGDLYRTLTFLRDRARGLGLIPDLGVGLDLDLVCARAEHLDALAATDEPPHLLVEPVGELADLLRHLVDRALRECRYAVQKQIGEGLDAIGLRIDVAMALGEEWGRRVRTALDRVADDFVDADVRAARLPDDADLTGVRWSQGTRWPRGWAGVVRARSEETAPGVFTVVGPDGRRSLSEATTPDDLPEPTWR